MVSNYDTFSLKSKYFITTFSKDKFQIKFLFI